MKLDFSHSLSGILRYFVLQCIPSLIHIYLLALAKRQKKSISMFETFLLAMYNEEILAGGTLSGSTTKKVEEVSIFVKPNLVLFIVCFLFKFVGMFSCVFISK